MGAVGPAPCAVALLVVGQVPTTTNGMLMYAQKPLGSKLSLFLLYVLNVSIFLHSKSFCYFYFYIIHIKNKQ